MGHRRQIERAERHQRGDFNEAKGGRRWYSSPAGSPSIIVRIYFKHRESDAVCIQKVTGPYDARNLIAAYKATFGNEIRILQVKTGRLNRWIKPEHPIALRRRLKRERLERLASKRIPVV